MKKKKKEKHKKRKGPSPSHTTINDTPPFPLVFGANLLVTEALLIFFLGCVKALVYIVAFWIILSFCTTVGIRPPRAGRKSQLACRHSLNV